MSIDMNSTIQYSDYERVSNYYYSQTNSITDTTAWTDIHYYQGHRVFFYDSEDITKRNEERIIKELCSIRNSQLKFWAAGYFYPVSAPKKILFINNAHIINKYTIKQPISKNGFKRGQRK